MVTKINRKNVKGKFVQDDMDRQSARLKLERLKARAAAPVLPTRKPKLAPLPGKIKVDRPLKPVTGNRGKPMAPKKKGMTLQEFSLLASEGSELERRLKEIDPRRSSLDAAVAKDRQKKNTPKPKPKPPATPGEKESLIDKIRRGLKGGKISSIDTQSGKNPKVTRSGDEGRAASMLKAIEATLAEADSIATAKAKKAKKKENGK